MDKRIVARKTRAAALALALLSGAALAACSKAEPGAGRGRNAPPAAPAKWEAAKGSALLVVNMQKGLMPIVDGEKVAAAIGGLVEKAEAAGALVVWVHSRDGELREGAEGFGIAPPLAPSPSHLRLVKEAPSAFSGTELEELLDARKVGRVVVCGISSDGCVNSTVQSAYCYGYRTVVASDAHSVHGPDASAAKIQAVNRSWAANPRLELLPSSKVEFSPAAGAPGGAASDSATSGDPASGSAVSGSAGASSTVSGSAAAGGLGAEGWAHSPAFAAFLDSSYRKLFARSPETATQLGLSAWAGLDDTRLDGLSLEYGEETRRLEREALAALKAYDRSGMTEDDKLSYEAYRRYLEDQVALQDFADMDFPVNPTVFGVIYATDSLFAEGHPLATPAEARSYVARLKALAGKIDEATEALRRREAKKAAAPRLVLEASMSDILVVANASARGTDFYERLERALGEMAGLGASERKALLAEAESAIGTEVIPAYAHLAAEAGAQASRAPAQVGLWQLPKGREYYAALLRARTTTSLTADEIHEMGLAALKRIDAEIMARAAKGTESPERSPSDVVSSAFVQAGRLGPEAALGGYKRLLGEAEERARKVFPLYPSAPVEVRTAPLGGYYAPGPVDGSRPGAFYVARGEGARKAAMPTLLFHETVPGHHLQQALAHELDLPVARKLLSSEAYVEGWALYAERLMAELGAYEHDPAGDLGRLQAEAFRAARLVVDTGIHAKRWSYDKAVDFMEARGLLDRGYAHYEVTRYASIPGQACSYYLGFLKILELRERAQKELGGRFDLGAFHTAILSQGALPLDLLDGVVDRYIAGAGGRQ